MNILLIAFIVLCPPSPTVAPLPDPTETEVVVIEDVPAFTDTVEPTVVASAVATFPKPKHTAVSGGAITLLPLLPETGVDQVGQRLRIWPLVVIMLLVVAAVMVVRRRVR